MTELNCLFFSSFLERRQEFVLRREVTRLFRFRVLGISINDADASTELQF